MRVGLQPLFGARDADEAQKLDGAGARFGLLHAAVVDQRLADLVADAHDRVQRRHRVLEDKADIAAAHLAQFLVRHLLQVVTIEARRALGNLDLVRQQPHQAQHGEALAAAGLADDAERLALVDVEVDTIDHDRRAVPAVDLDGQAADIEQFLI